MLRGTETWAWPAGSGLALRRALHLAPLDPVSEDALQPVEERQALVWNLDERRADDRREVPPASRALPGIVGHQQRTKSRRDHARPRYEEADQQRLPGHPAGDEPDHADHRREHDDERVQQLVGPRPWDCEPAHRSVAPPEEHPAVLGE